MSWTIERRGRVAVVTMTTNPVNAQNRASADLVDRAVAIAELTPEDCLGSYAFTERACQAAALRDIAELADPLDTDLPGEFTTDDARHAHRRYWQQPKKAPAPW